MYPNKKYYPLFLLDRAKYPKDKNPEGVNSQDHVVVEPQRVP
jgi:hypothetical protein